MCLNDNRYKNICRWHDYHIRCMPKNHPDTAEEWCDVRSNSNQALPSKWKCNNPPYNKDCIWMDTMNKCQPRGMPTPQPTPFPTDFPTPSPTLTNLYSYCDIRKGNGYPNKNKCLKDKKYKEKCRWHDFHIRCMPKNHPDTAEEWCDVRNNNNQAWPSKWKCLHKPYKEDCMWDNNKNKCIPKSGIIISQPTKFPTNYPTPYPTSFPTKENGMGMGMGKRT